MDYILKKDLLMTNELLEKMISIPDIVIYGDTLNCSRAASISFNILNMDHGLVAAILNDYFNIAVRNECFCAHPYVKEMIIDDLLESTDDIDEANFDEEIFLKSGMVRVSVGIYNTKDDIDSLIFALKEIILRKDELSPLYSSNSDGDYFHTSFKSGDVSRFTIKSFVCKKFFTLSSNANISS